MFVLNKHSVTAPIERQLLSQHGVLRGEKAMHLNVNTFLLPSAQLPGFLRHPNRHQKLRPQSEV